MTSHFPTRAVAAASLLVFASIAGADQIGQANFPTPSSPVGGVRASFPSPHLGTGRNGTLLNRGGSLLPPSAPPASVSPRSGPSIPMGAAPGPAGFNGVVRPGGGRFDTPCFAPTPTGSTVDGNFSDDRFRLKFHIGAGAGGWCPTNPCHTSCPTDSCNTHCPTNPCHRTCWNIGSPWWGWPWGWGWYDRSPSVIYSGPWYGTDPFVTQGVSSTSTPAAPAPAAAATPREPTLIERADAAWQSGRPDAAAGLLKQYLAGAPDDTDVVRYLAMAYIDQKRIDEAVALMASAYEKMPQLAARPLPASAIPGGLDVMRKRVNAVSAFANQTKTASSWLTMAVLVQSEGRLEIARKLVEKAKAAGLSERVATELVNSLGN